MKKDRVTKQQTKTYLMYFFILHYAKLWYRQMWLYIVFLQYRSQKLSQSSLLQLAHTDILESIKLHFNSMKETKQNILTKTSHTS